jgi:ABC-type branched-subunit amino acid transport system substrate-binding protein
MRLTSRLVAASAAAVLIAGALVGCRSDGGGPNTDDAGITTDFGVTTEPCPEAIDETKGCIYLGTLSDLTVGPFQPLAVPIVAAQKAFWNRVNEAGGIGGYEIDVTTYVGDNKYDPQVTTQVYQEMKPNILALAQTLGSPTTAAILPDLKASSIVAAPAAWTSAYAFEDVILESGASYCYESMNAVEYATSERPNIAKVMAVHYPGDYGGDAAAGARIAAEELGLEFTDVPTGPGGGEAQTAAIAQIVTERPGLVILTTGPTEAATIVGGVALQAQTSGYAPLFIGTSPTWNPALLGSPAAPALTALYLQSGPWGSWGSDTPGHEAMREALGEPDPLNDGYTAGWVWSYPLKAALEKAAENGDLTRAGLLAAAKSLTEVDYEGMLPAGAGNYAAGAAGVVKATQFSKPDASEPTGVAIIEELMVGEIADGYELTEPCYDLA